MSNLIFLDFETYYDSEYSLSKMSTQSYIHDPRFKIHGCGIAFQKTGGPVWYPKDNITYFKSDLEHAVVICHNATFDVAILEWVYGIHPKFVIDTVSLSRALIGGAVKSHSLDSIATYLLGESKGDYLPFTKGIRDLTEDQEKKLAGYCLRDVDLCRQIFFKLIPHIPMEELRMADWCRRAFTQPKLVLDTQVLQSHYDNTVRLKEEALESVYFMLGGTQ